MSYRQQCIAIHGRPGNAARAPAAGRTGVPKMVETSQSAPTGGVRRGQHTDFGPGAREWAGPGAAPALGGVGTAGGPLAGVRVLELGSLIAGPFAGRQLADFG